MFFGEAKQYNAQEDKEFYLILKIISCPTKPTLLVVSSNQSTNFLKSVLSR